MQRASALVIAVLTLGLVACGTTRQVGGGTTAVTTPATDAAATSTTAAPSTSLSTSTTAAPTTSTALPVAFTLRAGGIGELSFGQPLAAVGEALMTEFGDVVSDESTEFPVAVGPAEFETAEGELGFVAPFSRSLCFGNGFCAVFGGGSPDDLSFVGWYYFTTDPVTEPDPEGLTTAAGITLGSRWSDHLDDITVGEGGCYTVGYGATSDGITLLVESSGEMFTSFDDAGNYVVGTPDPADVTVFQMEAGDQMRFLFGDC